MGSRVELFAAIRRDARVDSLSIRELADKHSVHRRTVRQALASAIPPPRKHRRGRRRGWSRSRRRSTRCCALIWMRRRNSVTPRGGCSPGWSRSTTRSSCRTRRCVITSPSGARRLPPRRASRWSGFRAADPSASGRRRGGLPRPVGDPAWSEDEDRAVHDAVVLLRPGRAPRVAHPRTGGVPGRTRPCVRASRRRAAGRRSATTTSTARSSRCCSGAHGRRTTAGSGSARTTGSTPSTACPVIEGSAREGRCRG